MKKTIGWLIAGGVLIIVGGIIFVVAMSLAGWDFNKMGTVKYETNTHLITEEFDKVNIDTRTTAIVFAKSEDDSCTVVCHEAEKLIHEVKVEDGTLSIVKTDTRKWYENINVDWGEPKITVYLPEKEYVSIAVKNSTGKILCENLNVESLILSVSTGEITVTSVNVGENIDIEASTGNIVLKDVITADKMSIKTSTGSVKFDGCDADEIYVSTSTGSVKGTFLSEKVFEAKTSTGAVDVPDTQNGGKCEIKTSTGDIRIEIK